MIVLNGKYNSAKVFTDNLESTAASQIVNLLNQEFIAGSTIRIMPDTHAGAGCTIGTTMTIEDKIVPNLVGVDIGCGMETLILKDKTVDLAKLDGVIHDFIPAGFATHKTPHAYAAKINIEELFCLHKLNRNRAVLSIGTLGGGNHFIELGKDHSGVYYLTIHSGSRNLGKQIAELYQQAAYDRLKEKSGEVHAIIEQLRREGREKEIQKKVDRIKPSGINKNLAYVEGELFKRYLHDMEIAQRYADLNRKAMADIIAAKMKFSIDDTFTTVHNYIDLKNKILRKGAVSAQKGERLLIPINMRDGSLVCTGKGNRDWNFSAPHGAGRLMSRSEAKAKISLSDFKESMEGIYSSTINKTTLDEAPFAYKPMDEIVNNITGTVEIELTVKPVYNFKSAE